MALLGRWLFIRDTDIERDAIYCVFIVVMFCIKSRIEKQKQKSWRLNINFQR